MQTFLLVRPLADTRRSGRGGLIAIRIGVVEKRNILLDKVFIVKRTLSWVLYRSILGVIMEKVAVNDFVRRQIKGSGKTYSSDLSFEEIASHAAIQMESGKFEEGYRDGVRIVSGSAEIAKKFICPFTKINKNTTLKSEIVKRRPNEEPYIQIRAANAEPIKTGRVEFILYNHDVLAENNEHTSDAEWELISIHAIPEGVDKLPMGPVTMMRNQLELPGGTKARYSSEEWAESIVFWQRYATVDI